uniref:Uncharacterized protein n=1 Tax=Cacopsylla melanoneura TaxID=428564 RepID=A0A8D9DNR1_9HEMI
MLRVDVCVGVAVCVFVWVWLSVSVCGWVCQISSLEGGGRDLYFARIYFNHHNYQLSYLHIIYFIITYLFCYLSHTCYLLVMLPLYYLLMLPLYDLLVMLIYTYL